MPEIKKLPSREKQHGVIRPMTTMEDWEDRALAAYESTNPIKRLDMLPDFGPGLMTRALKGRTVWHGTQAAKNAAAELPFTELHDMAWKEIDNSFGSGWHNKLSIDEANKIVTKKMSELRSKLFKNKTFKHFEEFRAGKGAGGNLFGEGIYLTEHPKIAAGYANYGWGVLRRQNLPPQAKLFDIHRKLTHTEMDSILDIIGNQRINLDAKDIANWKKWSRQQYPNGISLQGLGIQQKQVKKVVTDLGYDGISYDAGKVMGLPKDVPEGTKNFVIYNYDIINNPRKVAIERGFKKAE